MGEVEDGKRIELFLQDDVVQGAFEATRLKYIAEWELGLSAEHREAAWHKLRALADIQKHLRVVVERGEAATAMLQRGKRTALI